MLPEEFLGIMVVLAIVAVIFFISMIVAGVHKGKTVANNLKSDDANPPQKVTGKVLEKIVDTRHERGAFEYDITIEWIVIEDANGMRRKIRNTKPKEILITTGDTGEFTLRGETIYGFKRTAS